MKECLQQWGLGNFISYLWYCNMNVTDQMPSNILSDQMFYMCKCFLGRENERAEYRRGIGLKSSGCKKSITFSFQMWCVLRILSWFLLKFLYFPSYETKKWKPLYLLTCFWEYWEFVLSLDLIIHVNHHQYFSWFIIITYSA